MVAKRGSTEFGGLVVIDDDDQTRLLLATAFRDHPTLRVAATAASSGAALEACASHQPAVIAVNVEVEDLDGQNLIVRLRSECPSSRVVVFSAPDTVRRVVTEGVEGVLDGHDVEVAALVRAVDAAVAGNRTVSLTLPGEKASVSRARRFTRATLRSWGCNEVTDDAGLVISELVANAIDHAGTECELRLEAADELLRVEVADKGPGSPQPRLPDHGQLGGRGLLLVSALSAAWGVDPQPPGKVVWAHLVLPTAQAA